jgi:hypothetical protein
MGSFQVKDLLCQAFCASLDVHAVPAGFAVTTPYENIDGDPLLVYFVRDGHGKWHVEDDGSQVPFLEASGVDLSGRSRGDAFQSLLSEYGASFDPEARTIRSKAILESETGDVAVRFVALLLRLQDLALMSPQIIRSAFREDALEAIHATFDSVADVEEHAALNSELAGHEADAIIKSQRSVPMAIYLATSEERALQALVAKMEAEKYSQIDGKVVLIVEKAKSNPVKEATYSLALARLDNVFAFRDAKNDTMSRLKQLAGLENDSFRVQ